MKICVYFQPKSKYEGFEGTRLQKSIKGALELVDIPYSRNIIDNYDIIHFVSPNDELKINDAIEANILTVFTAFMSETDPTTRLFELKGNSSSISLRALRLLNKIDLILVSDETSKNLLIKNGVETPIKVVPVGVNISRFEMTSQLESDIFYNYYQLSKESKFVVSVGSYEDKDKYSSLCEIARRCPNCFFYYFGKSKGSRPKLRIKNIPPNLQFHLLANEEIYRSMMKNASIYLSFDNRRHSPITLMDAAASKTQIVSLQPNEYNSELLEKLYAYSGNSVEEVSDYINKIINNEIKTKVESAYKVAQNNSLKNLGKSLYECYSDLLKGEEKND